MGDKTYKLNNKVYSIPQDRNEAFLNSYPDAKEVETFVLGQDTFDVPIDRVDAFLNKMPDAKPLSFQAKQKPVEGGGVATDVLDEEPPKLTQEQEVYLQAGRDDFNKQLGRSQYQPELSRIPQKERGEDVVPYTEQDQEQFIKDAEARDADIQKRKAGELTTEEAEKLGVAVSDRIKGMKEGIDLTIPIGEKAKTEGYYERQKQEKIKSLDAQESVLAKQRDDITKYYDDALKENPDLQSEAYLAYSKVNNELQKVINNKKELGVVPESNFSKLSNNELLSDKEELVDDYLKYLESDNKSGYNLLTDKLNQGKLNEKEQWDYIINPALQKRVDELQVNVEILKARGELPVAEVAEIYDLYNAYNLNKYRGEVKGDKFSYGEGSLKAFHLAVADSYEFFDNLGKSVADITGLGDALLEKGWKERGGAFKSLADWARTDVENLDELPPTWVGTALETSIGMTVLMGEMMLTPTLTVEKLPFMTSGAIVAIPKLMTLEGSKGFFNSYANNISDGKLTWKEIGESLEKGGKGAFYGALLHSMGVSSTGLSKFSAQFVKSKLLPVMVSTTAMGGMFTLYDAYNQWEQTGEIDWGEATAKGAGASILSIPYVSNALANDVYVKARSKYLASSDNLIKFALKLEEDPRSVDKRIKTLSKQISLLGDGKERSDLVNQRESLLNLVRIKFMAEDVISNPEKYRKEIRESDMPDESKDYFYQKITNTLLNVPEKKLSAPEFQRKVINNEIIRLQQRLFDLKNRNTEGQFDVDIKDINYQVDLHYKQLEEIKKYSGEPETKFKKEIEEREKKFQEYQAKMEDYIKKATVGMSVDKMVRPLVVPKNKDENEFNIRAVNNHIVELSKEIGKLKLEENPDKLAIQRKEIERDLFYGDLEDLKNEYYGPKETITTEKKLPGEAEKGIGEEVLPGKEVKAGEKEVIEEKKPEEVKAEKDFIGFDKFAESIGTKEDVSDIVGERSRKGNIAGADVIIDVGSKDGFVKIESLSVPKEKRQQGIATKALDELISKADEQGLGLEVVAVPEEGADISKENLIKFYEKNGFEFEGDKGTRKPKEIKLEEKEAPKEAPLKKEPVKFDVDERVVFTAKDGKQYDVNFRGYVGDFTKAVIVGKVEDKIDQMQVDVSQLSKMPEGGLKPEKKPPEEKPKEVPPKEEGVPPEEKKPEEIPEEKTIDGVKYVRQKPGVVEVRGTKDEVKFSRKDYIPFEYAAIEADKLQPSHKGDLENPMFFNKEMQPKSRKGRASLKEQINIARKPRFKEISEGVIAYSGAPVVNERGEVVQGNNRAVGLIAHYKNKGKIYKEDFIKNAEKFGLKGEDINKMENPILVRVINITDAKGKELGNYTVQDLETGGKDRIEAVPMAKRIPSDVKSKMANILFGGEEDITLKESIRKNFNNIVKLLRDQLSDSQIENLYNKATGDVRSTAIDDMVGVVEAMLFEGKGSSFSDVYYDIPAKARTGIEKSLPNIFNIRPQNSILPDLQNAVMALHEFENTGITKLNTWLRQSNVFDKPAMEKYTPLEIELLKLLIESKTQKEVKLKLAEYEDVSNGRAADMFNPEVKPLNKKDAVEKVFGVDYELTARDKIAAEAERAKIDLAEDLKKEPENELLKKQLDQLNENNLKSLIDDIEMHLAELNSKEKLTDEEQKLKTELEDELKYYKDYKELKDQEDQQNAKGTGTKIDKTGQEKGTKGKSPDEIRLLNIEKDRLEANARAAEDLKKKKKDDDEGWDTYSFASESAKRGGNKRETGIRGAMKSPIDDRAKKTKETIKDWVKNELPLETELKSVDFPELVLLVSKLINKYPKLFNDYNILKFVGGKFRLNKKTGEKEILINRELAQEGYEKILRKVIAHEIGHAIDNLGLGKKMGGENILGKIKSASDYIKNWLKESPGKEDNALTDADVKRLEAQAKKELEAEYRKGIREIIEEVIKDVPIFKEGGLTGEDILAIWRDVEARTKYPELYEYIARLSSFAKKQIMVDAMKGLVESEVAKKFNIQIGTKQVKEKVKRVIKPEAVNEENIKKALHELILNEINKRRLFDKDIITKELEDLSMYWDSFDKNRDPKYTEYRNSPGELYAQALSVFLNDPQLLLESAPHFYKAFTNFLPNKPDFKILYEQLQELAGLKKEDLIKARYDRMTDMFVRSQERLNELTNMKKVRPFSLWGKFVNNFVSEVDPAIWKLERERGLSKDFTLRQKVRDAFEKMAYSDMAVYRFVDKMEGDVGVILDEAGVKRLDFSSILKVERNLYDETRRDKFNPLGMQTKESAEIKEYILSKYNEEQRGAIKLALQKFHDNVFDIMEKAYNEGMYSDKLFNDVIVYNKDYYSTDLVVRYLPEDGLYVSPAIKAVTGNLGEIADPYVATQLKMAAIIQATSKQRAINTFIPELVKINEASKAKGAGKFIKKQVTRDKALLYYLDKGTLRAYKVDKYIAEAFSKARNIDLGLATDILSNFNKVFKPLVTTYNPGFLFYMNLFRDANRTLQNTNTILFATKGVSNWAVLENTVKFLPRMARSISKASSYLKGNNVPILNEMLEKGVIGRQFYDKYDPNTNQDIATIFRAKGILAKEGSITDKIRRQKVIKPLVWLVDKMLHGGSAIELSSKLLAYENLKKYLDNPDLAAFYARSFAGTPNYRNRGKYTSVTNEVLPFSNVIVQALKTDMNLAFSPTTAGGFWLQKTLVAVIPAMITAAATTGLLGDELKKLYSGIGKYDKSNYVIVPVDGYYVRVPIDDVGRVIHNFVYNTLTGFKNPGELVTSFGSLSPSPSPLIDIGVNWSQYFAHKNPYDSFYGNYVISDRKWIAGGMDPFYDMLRWTGKKTGLRGIVNIMDKSKGEDWDSYLIKNMPVFNRFIKESGKGEEELYRSLNDEIRKETTKESLKRNEMLMNYIYDAINNKDTKEKLEDRSLNKLKVEIFGSSDLSGNDKRKWTNMKKDIMLHFQIGKDFKHQEIISSFRFASSNKSKFAAINMFNSLYDNRETVNVLKILDNSGYISKQFYDAYKKEFNDMGFTRGGGASGQSREWK